MTTQPFKTIVAKEGSRIYIAIPFNPNEVWGVKQRHHITGTVNGCAVRGSLGSDGSQYFLPLVHTISLDYDRCAPQPISGGRTVWASSRS